MKNQPNKAQSHSQTPCCALFQEEQKDKERSPSRLTQQAVMPAGTAGTKNRSQVIVLQTQSLLTMQTLAVIVFLSNIMKCSVLG